MKIINERNRLKSNTKYVVNSDLSQYDKWIKMYKNYNYVSNTDLYTVLTTYQQYLESLNSSKSSISRKLSNIKNHHRDFLNFVKIKRSTPIKIPETLSLESTNVVSPTLQTDTTHLKIPSTEIDVKKDNPPNIYLKKSNQNFPKNNSINILIFFSFIAVVFSFIYILGYNGNSKVPSIPLSDLAISNSHLLNNQKITLSLSVKNLSKKDESLKSISLSIYSGRTSIKPISKANCSFNVVNSKDDDILIVDLEKYCSKKFLNSLSPDNYLSFQVNNNPESYPRLSVADVLNPSFYSYFDDSSLDINDTQTDIVKSLRSKLLNSFDERVKITPIFDILSPTATATQAASISATLNTQTPSPSPTP